jgi:hypothetical protein
MRVESAPLNSSLLDEPGGGFLATALTNAHIIKKIDECMPQQQLHSL